MKRDAVTSHLFSDECIVGYGPATLTPEQRERIEVCAQRTKLRRQMAERRPIFDPSTVGGRPLNCSQCRHVSDFNAEHQRGWCTWLRLMVSSRNPVDCKAFEAKK